MRLQYEWRQKEWQEAVRLVSRRPGAAPALPGITLATIALPLLGGVSELVAAPAMRQHLQAGGSLAPVLLAIFVGVLALRFVRGRISAKRLRPVPELECHAVLSEAGWRVGTDAAGDLWPWSDLVGIRRGENVLVLLRKGDFEALPLRALTPDQGSRLHRLLMRKLRQRLLP